VPATPVVPRRNTIALPRRSAEVVWYRLPLGAVLGDAGDRRLGDHPPPTTLPPRAPAIIPIGTSSAPDGRSPLRGACCAIMARPSRSPTT